MIAMGMALFGRPPGLVATERAWPLPPRHPRVPTKVGNFGRTRVDEFAWMRPKDWLAVLRDPQSLDAPIAKAVKAENRYADAMLGPSAADQKRLHARADALHRLNDVPLEVEEGDFIYLTRPSVVDGAATAYVRRPVGADTEELLLDVGAEAAGKPSFNLSWAGARHSPDGKLVGWAQDLTGSGVFQIRVREIATGRILVSDIDAGHGGFAFDPAGRHLFWIGRDENGTANSVWRRDMQTGEDVRIHAEADPSFFIEVRTLASGEFVLFRMLNGAQTEAWLVRAGDPKGTPLLVQKRQPDLRYDVEHWNGRLIILTDADGAADQKLMTASLDKPGKAHWQTLVEHQPGRFIAAIHPFRNYLVREEWRDALPRLVVMGSNGKERDVRFDEPAYAIHAPAGQSWDAPTLAFSYESPRLPRRAYSLLLAEGRARPASEAPKETGFDSELYAVERIEAVAADGARVPITLVSRRGSGREGKAPLYLYGYGSYGATVDASFNPAALALVDAGWTYAIAHVRGGAERGNGWWRSVLKKGKRKTFTDFITCAELLIEQKYSAKGRIVAHGYSAGGLLMGAVYTMRPDLWAGVIAQVPFVDPLNTMDYFETHPLRGTAMPIWGDPRIPDEYDYIASYSPYDNLKAAPYPALLATGNVADERVSFFEPLKFAAKARALTTAYNPIMVRVSMLGGHVWPPGSKLAREQDAVFGAFAMWAADHRWGNVRQR